MINLVFFGLVFLCIFGYVYILFVSQATWKKTDKYPKRPPEIPFSIIIPARNEELHIIPCLESIIASNYPIELLDIIVIDDHSEDDTLGKARSLSCDKIRVIQLKNYIDNQAVKSYKKKAISLGIVKAKHEHIFTMDADCILNKERLNILQDLYTQKKSSCIAGPINIKTSGSLLEDFQCLDNAGMMAITNLGIKNQHWHLANGANLSFTKNTYNKYERFQSGKDRASGDDVFLIQTIAKEQASSIFFNHHPSAIVETEAMPNFRAFASQRARWASKNSQYKQIKLNLFMGFIWFTCCMILLSLFLSPFYAMLAIFLKMLADSLYLKRILPFFKEDMAFTRIMFLSIFHTVYVAFFGVLSLISPSFKWKGRNVK